MNIEVKGDKMIITIDVSKKAIASASLSKSGKNKVVATTNGFVTHGDFRVGLNVITSKE